MIFRPALVFAPGNQVGPGPEFAATAAVGYFNIGLGRVRLLGQSPTIGFRVIMNGLPHYGWVELNHETGVANTGIPLEMYQPVRWAFETTPNTPIGVPIPSPAGAALLGVGAMGFALRRRPDAH